MAEGGVPDNGPIMTGAIWFICLFSLVFLIARIYVRFTTGIRLWWDDWVILVSWLCLLGETATTQAAIGKGLGQYITDIPSRQHVLEIVIYGQIGLAFVAFAISLSKISFALTLLRLTDGWWRRLVWLTIVTMALLILPAVVFPWVQCRPFEKSLDPTIPGHCFDKNIALDYSVFMSAWNAFMDFVLAAIPWTVLAKMKMNFTEKIGVGVCMSLGVLAGVVAIIKTTYIKDFASTDFSYNSVNITCWSATESAAAIIASSIPVLRAFIRQKAATKSYASHELSRVGGSTIDPKDPRRVVNEVWVSAMRKRDDDESDRSILHEGQGPPSGGILQTSTFMVDAHSETDSRRESTGSKLER